MHTDVSRVSSAQPLLFALLCPPWFVIKKLEHAQIASPIRHSLLTNLALYERGVPLLRYEHQWIHSKNHRFLPWSTTAEQSNIIKEYRKCLSSTVERHVVHPIELSYLKLSRTTIPTKGYKWPTNNLWMSNALELCDLPCLTTTTSLLPFYCTMFIMPPIFHITCCLQISSTNSMALLPSLEAATTSKCPIKPEFLSTAQTSSTSCMPSRLIWTQTEPSYGTKDSCTSAQRPCTTCKLSSPSSTCKVSVFQTVMPACKGVVSVSPCSHHVPEYGKSPASTRASKLLEAGLLQISVGPFPQGLMERG